MTEIWSDLLLEQLMMFVIAYALILTITFVVDSREKMARQMTETARLNEELSKAQVAALRGQMDPHFMFHTSTRSPVLCTTSAATQRLG